MGDNHTYVKMRKWVIYRLATCTHVRAFIYAHIICTYYTHILYALLKGKRAAQAGPNTRASAPTYIKVHFFFFFLLLERDVFDLTQCVLFLALALS